MTLGNYELFLSAPNGRRIGAITNALAIDYTRVVNDIGAFSVSLNSDAVFSDYAKDSVIEIWRAPVFGGVKRLDFAGFVRGRQRTMDGSGNETVTIYGPCANYLLSARIVGYYAGSTYSQKTDYADDMMNEIMRENFGASSTDTARSWATNGFTVQSDASLAPSITMAFAWRNVLYALQDIAYASKNQGTDLYFGVEPYEWTNNRLSFRFRTAINQYGSARDLIISPNNGTLSAPYYDEDYRGEFTYAFAGGQGQGVDRTIVEAYDTSRINSSTWARREVFADARGDSTSAVAATAYNALAENYPVARIGGTISDTPHTRYGVDWNFGDRLALDYAGVQADAVVNGINVSVSPSGESINARLESMIYG